MDLQLILILNLFLRILEHIIKIACSRHPRGIGNLTTSIELFNLLQISGGFMGSQWTLHLLDFILFRKNRAIQFRFNLLDHQQTVEKVELIISLRVFFLLELQLFGV